MDLMTLTENELAPFEPKPYKPTPLGVGVELHLSPDASLPKRFGKKIKGVGGKYGEARGNANTRYVHLPATPEGIALADVLVDEFAQCKGDYFNRKKRAGTTVILRSTVRQQAGAIVHKVGNVDGGARFPTVEAMVAALMPKVEELYEEAEATRRDQHDKSEARRKEMYDLDRDSRALIASLQAEGRTNEAQLVANLRNGGLGYGWN